LPKAHNAPLQKETNAQNKWQAKAAASPPNQSTQSRTDIQAALDFLGAPIEEYEKRANTPLNLPFTDLSGVDLLSAHLNDAHLNDANLLGANLLYAILVYANLNSANLTGAVLFHANLTGATLNDAHLNDANLYRANLVNAHLVNADLTSANLIGANLNHVYLSEAHGLNQNQIDSANGDETTQLPPSIHMPERWKKSSIPK
jgi:uncharacterized protein YjbI with pentapeptide repeats